MTPLAAFDYITQREYLNIPSTCEGIAYRLYDPETDEAQVCDIAHAGALGGLTLDAINEILESVGLDEVKESLDHALTTLEDLVEDIHPDVVPNLDRVLAGSLLRPLQSQVGMLETLLEELAA